MTSTYENILTRLQTQIPKAEIFEPKMYRYHVTIDNKFFDVPSIYWEQEDELFLYLIKYFKEHAPEVLL